MKNLIRNRIRKAEGLVQLYLGPLLGIGLDIPHHPKPSLRAMARSKEGLSLEGLRGRLRKLGERNEEIITELARVFGDGDESTLCLMDPTYLRETEERLLVFAIHDELSGKAIPVWWDYQEWETLRKNPPLSANLLVERSVRKLKKNMGHSFTLVADREFPSQRFKARLRKEGIGYVIRLRENSAPPMKGERGTTYRDKRYKESWNLVSRNETNPVKAYKKRMRIEHLFRDLKGLFGMRDILRRIRDPMIRKGLVLLIMLAWLLAFLRGLYAIIKGLLSQDDPLLKDFLKGRISIITLAMSLSLRELERLRSPCATSAYEESRARTSIQGGVKCVR